MKILLFCWAKYIMFILKTYLFSTVSVISMLCSPTELSRKISLGYWMAVEMRWWSTVGVIWNFQFLDISDSSCLNILIQAQHVNNCNMLGRCASLSEITYVNGSANWDPWVKLDPAYFVNKVLLAISHGYSFFLLSGYFHAPVAESSSCDRGGMARQV